MAMLSDHDVSPPPNAVLRNVFSRLSDAAYSVSHKLKRISDYVQGHAALSQSCAWLMGIQYGSTAAQSAKDARTLEFQEQLLQDFKSRVWCTYRRDFPPLGPDGLVGDVGWGCTIRTGQMMMAEVLSRHLLGRTWRRDHSVDPSMDAKLVQLLSLFSDHPQAPVSIHQICAAGKPHGMVPGKWLGPWVLCRGLASLINGTPQLGLRMHVVCDPGGGAPSIDAAHLLSLVGAVTHKEAPGQPQPLPPAAAATHAPPGPPLELASTDMSAPAPADPLTLQPQGEEAPSAAISMQEDLVVVTQQPSLGGTDLTREEGSMVDVLPPAQPGNTDVSPLEGEVSQAGASVTVPAQQEVNGEAEMPSHPCGDVPGHVCMEAERVSEGATEGPDSTHCNGASQVQQSGLVLLLPLTLGVGRANALYYPQLLQVLSFPQSVGIVGGRPSASLYFIGHQDQNLLYLDPHIPQPAGPLPAAMPTYFCDTVRLMPISNIDPSLAIGFYCRGAEELEDLIKRLDRLAVEHRKAPLVTVTDPSVATARADMPHRTSCGGSPPGSRHGMMTDGTHRTSGEWEVAHGTSGDSASGRALGANKRRADGKLVEGEELDAWEML